MSGTCRELRNRYRGLQPRGHASAGMFIDGIYRPDKTTGTVSGGGPQGRTTVIGRFPGAACCLTMAWAVMDLVIAGSRVRAVPQTGQPTA